MFDNGSLTYDAEGRIIRSVGAFGVITTYALNAAGNTLTKVEAAGELVNGQSIARTTQYLYDQDGTRLRVEVAADGGIAVMDYEGTSDRITKMRTYDQANYPAVTTLAEFVALADADALRVET